MSRVEGGSDQAYIRENNGEGERKIEGRDTDKFYRLFIITFDYLWYTV